MRLILAIAVLLLGLSSAAPEPEYSSLLPGSFHLGGGDSFVSLVEIESSLPRGDRAAVAEPPSEKIGGQTPALIVATAPQAAAAPSPNSAVASAQLPTPSEADTAPSVPLDVLCNALLTSAQDNDLPIAFFANLIWQESRLRDDAVSPKGALGIAQFMPEVAVASGLENPFDPLQALTASARLLRELRDQFGNLGLVAAAYNAGAKRVDEWLERRRALPRETRGYVVDVTGRSVEQWRKRPPDDAALHFVRRLPCRDLPAFAELEQAQLERTRQAQQPQKSKAAGNAEATAHLGRAHFAERRHLRAPSRRERIRTAERERIRGRHEAKERVRRAPRQRHRRA